MVRTLTKAYGPETLLAAKDGAPGQSIVDKITRLAVSGPTPGELPMSEEILDVIQRGDVHALEEFLRTGGHDINAPVMIVGGSLLAIVCGLGKTAMAKALIAAGADLDIRMEANGGTALFAAASNGHRSAVKMLLQAGANTAIRGRNSDGKGTACTPAESAEERGHLEIAALLREHEDEFGAPSAPTDEDRQLDGPMLWQVPSSDWQAMVVNQSMAEAHKERDEQPEPDRAKKPASAERQQRRIWPADPASGLLHEKVGVQEKADIFTEMESPKFTGIFWALGELCAVCGKAPVGGRKRVPRCTQCLDVAYCCVEHQKKGWKHMGHKKSCTAPLPTPSSVGAADLLQVMAIMEEFGQGHAGLAHCCLLRLYIIGKASRSGPEGNISDSHLKAMLDAGAMRVLIGVLQAHHEYFAVPTRLITCCSQAKATALKWQLRVARFAMTPLPSLCVLFALSPTGLPHRVLLPRHADAPY